MPVPRESLFTAADVAVLCRVDLKTIHNWVERGRIPHFRTPGRHLRFRAPDVAAFLRTWGYSVPRELARAEGQAVVYVGSKEGAATVQRALGDGFGVRHLPHLYDALLRAGAEAPDACVLDAKLVAPEGDVASVCDALLRAFAQAKLVVVSGEGVALPEAVVRLDRLDAVGLRAALGAPEPPPAARPERRAAKKG